MALWTPAEISAQIIQQIDPDDESKRTIATGFAALNNVIGGTLNYTQSTTSVQPLLVAAELNGLDVMRLDGSKMMNSPRVLTDDNFSAFCIIKAGAQNNKDILAQHDGTTATGRMQLLACSHVSPYNNVKVFFNNGTTYSVLSTTVAYDSTWNLIYSESDGAGRTTIRVDAGAEEGTLTGQTWTPLDTMMRLGGVGSTPNLSADIAYILICTKLSAADRQRVEGWLMWRFGLEANLPADHPYKSAAPTLNKVSGTVTVNGSPAARTVAVFRRSDFTLLGTTTSNATTGAFEILNYLIPADANALLVTALDSTGTYNAVSVDYITSVSP